MGEDCRKEVYKRRKVMTERGHSVAEMRMTRDLVNNKILNLDNHRTVLTTKRSSTRPSVDL